MQYSYIGAALDRLQLHRSDWLPIFNQEAQMPYFEELTQKLSEDIAQGKKVFPEAFDLFSAFAFCSYRNTRVVILGESPYYEGKNANGLAFSAPFQKDPSPALKNIFRELRRDLGIPKKAYLNPSLGKWAVQGVLLLNTYLSATEGDRERHKNIGWQEFTEAVIDYICLKNHPVIFVLLGPEAQRLEYMITSQHYVIKLPDPNPGTASDGFIFSGLFSKINNILSENGMGKIDWDSIKLDRNYVDA